MPFYSWQCITLQLKHRDVDLIIRDEREMDLFLKLLINHMCTLDGRRDSARPLLDALQREQE